MKSITFLSCIKSADVTPLHEKGKKYKKDNYKPVIISLTLSKCFGKLILTKYFRNVNMVSERGAVFNIVFKCFSHT